VSPVNNVNNVNSVNDVARRNHRVLVTGAAGFAGSHLIELLLADGVDVTAWHRPGSDVPLAAERLRWSAVDLLDRRAVVDQIGRDQPNVVYHCAGAAHVGRAWDNSTPTFEVNVRGTHYLIEALRDAKLSPVLFIPSSAMVYRPTEQPISEDAAIGPSNPYGLSKLAQERLALRAMVDGVDVRVGRAFNHVGPRQDPSFAASGFAKQVAEIEAGMRAPEIVVGNLEARREATHVRDTVRAYQAIVERGTPGRHYNVSSGQAYAVGEILERLIAKARIDVRVRVDPTRLRPNDVRVFVGNPARLRNELGWTPAIDLERTLADLLEYWRDRVR
jgi:GDP-4-dehydro-6-deoxy-D-mannose reductase